MHHSYVKLDMTLKKFQALIITYTSWEWAVPSPGHLDARDVKLTSNNGRSRIFFKNSGCFKNSQSTRLFPLDTSMWHCGRSGISCKSVYSFFPHFQRKLFTWKKCIIFMLWNMSLKKLQVKSYLFGKNALDFELNHKF